MRRQSFCNLRYFAGLYLGRRTVECNEMVAVPNLGQQNWDDTRSVIPPLERAWTKKPPRCWYKKTRNLVKPGPIVWEGGVDLYVVYLKLYRTRSGGGCKEPGRKCIYTYERRLDNTKKPRETIGKSTGRKEVIDSDQNSRKTPG